MKNNRQFYVNRNAFKRKQSLMLRFMLVIGVMFASIAVYSTISEPHNAVENLCITAGSGSLAMAGMATIRDVDDSQTTGSAISHEVYLLPVDEIDRKVFPKIGANREVPTIRMLPNKFMHYAETHTPPAFIANYSKEAGAITVTASNTFTIVLGGFRDDVLNLVEKRIGTKFIILFKECSSGITYGTGSICQPMILSTSEIKNDADNRSATLTFTKQGVELPWKYIGDITEQDPVNVAGGATSIPLVSGNDQYIISNGTAAPATINAVTGITATDEGRTITFIGDGTDKPAQIADGLPFLLKNGETWTATQGSMLVMRIFDANTLVEHSRS